MKIQISITVCGALCAIALAGCGTAASHQSADSGPTSASPAVQVAASSPVNPSANSAPSKTSDPNCGVLQEPSVDADGDTAYIFTMPNGSIVTTYDPGSDLLMADGTLNAANLTPERAEKLGIGVEPKDPQQHKVWSSMIRGLQHKGVAPKAPCFMPGMTAG